MYRARERTFQPCTKALRQEELDGFRSREEAGVKECYLLEEKKYKV